jgi:hypothetical protein
MYILLYFYWLFQIDVSNATINGLIDWTNKWNEISHEELSPLITTVVLWRWVVEASRELSLYNVFIYFEL